MFDGLEGLTGLEDKLTKISKSITKDEYMRMNIEEIKNDNSILDKELAIMILEELISSYTIPNWNKGDE